jgi:hypothetical protein
MTQQVEVVLPCTGRLPLKLNGTLLASESTEIVNGSDRNRWHKVDVYQASKFVAHVQWRTRWQGEQPNDTCIVEESIHKLAEHLLKYDPLEFLVGFPEGAQFDRKQERLEQAIIDDWSAMLTRLFLSLNVTESL